MQLYSFHVLIVMIIFTLQGIFYQVIIYLITGSPPFCKGIIYTSIMKKIQWIIHVTGKSLNQSHHYLGVVCTGRNPVQSSGKWEPESLLLWRNNKLQQWI